MNTSKTPEKPLSYSVNRTCVACVLAWAFYNMIVSSRLHPILQNSELLHWTWPFISVLCLQLTVVAPNKSVDAILTVLKGRKQ